MNHLEELVEEWLSLCGYSPRASSSQQAEILQAAVAGIPRVAQAIAAIPAEHRASAFGAAERCYMQTAKDLGGADKFAHDWASAVTLRLRAEVEQQVLANRKPLKALDEELVRTESADAQDFREIRQRRRGTGAVKYGHKAATLQHPGWGGADVWLCAVPIKRATNDETFPTNSASPLGARTRRVASG